MVWLAVCLAIAYPVLTHAAVILNAPWLQWLALTTLVALALVDALAKRRAWAWLSLLTTSLAFLGLVRFGGGMYLLYVPPIVLPGALLVLFARSLRAGSVPLITRFAAAVRETLPDDLARYTGHVTMVWTAAFALLAASALICALFATHAVWSVMTNFVHYLFSGALFLGEYLFRVYKFRHLPHPGFVGYLRMLFTTRIRSL